MKTIVKAVGSDLFPDLPFSVLPFRDWHIRAIMLQNEEPENEDFLKYLTLVSR